MTTNAFVQKAFENLGFSMYYFFGCESIYVKVFFIGTPPPSEAINHLK